MLLPSPLLYNSGTGGVSAFTCDGRRVPGGPLEKQCLASSGNTTVMAKATVLLANTSKTSCAG